MDRVHEGSIDRVDRGGPCFVYVPFERIIGLFAALSFQDHN